MLLCVAVCGNMSTVDECVAVCCSVLKCVAVCCSVLQCVAVCCSVLQCVAGCGNMSTVDECVCATLIVVDVSRSFVYIHMPVDFERRVCVCVTPQLPLSVCITHRCCSIEITCTYLYV